MILLEKKKMIEINKNTETHFLYYSECRSQKTNYIILHPHKICVILNVQNSSWFGRDD